MVEKNQENEIVAFDVDEIFFPLLKVAIKALNTRFGCNINSEDYTTYNIKAWLEKNYPEIHTKLEETGGVRSHFNWIGDKNLILNIPPFEGSSEVTKQIKNTGRKIAIVTYRGTPEEPDLFCKDGLKKTEEWLKKFNINYDYIKFTNKKGEALEELEKETGKKVVLFVEDHPHNAISAINKGFSVALLDKPHNKKELPEEVCNSPTIGMKAISQEIWEKALSSGKIHRIEKLNEIQNLLSVTKK